MNRYDLAIFDFDGTLADSADWFFGTLNEVAVRFGFRETTPPEREALRGCDNREIIRALRVPMWKMPAIARHMRRRASENVAAIRLFDGVPEALARLRTRGVKVAIVSSNAEQNVRHVFGPELAPIVAHYGGGSSLFGKAAKLRQAMKRLEVAPTRAVYVGDETRDIDAAHATGAASAAVTWGYALPEALARRSPTITLTDVAAMGDL